MVHPLNELKDLKKARAEITKVKKAAGSVVTHDEFTAAISNVRAEFAEALDAALAPVRAALEIDDLDHAIDELDGPQGEPDEAGEDPEP